MRKRKKCYSGIGGQAVLEGIMMKNKTTYSVAVRKPDGSIDVEVSEYTGVFGDSALTKIPFVRGIFNFVDSMVLGTRALNHSATFFEEEDTSESKADKMLHKIFKDRAEHFLVMLTTVIAIVLAVGIFMVLPYFITDHLLDPYVRNASLKAILEGVIRLVIFIAYVLSISLMKDIRRVYMYHGAEHKCINCIEHGKPLTVKNVMKSSKQHRRCGTSFLLFVMLISIILFFFIRVDQVALKVLLRIALIPVIAGIAYEVIRLAGKTDNILVRMISAPGMWLQALTTREPDEDMVEVAIKAVEAVFDWRAYEEEVFGRKFSDDNAEGDPAQEDAPGGSDEGSDSSEQASAQIQAEKLPPSLDEEEEDEPTFIGSDEEI